MAERFLEQADDESFNAVFRVFSPQLVAFFRRRGHEKGIAEDLAQEVMLTAIPEGRTAPGSQIISRLALQGGA